MAGGAKLERYKELWKKLWPRGKAWDFEEQPVLSKLLDSSSIEFCRVDDFIDFLLREADPRITSALLTDWERLLGLPDECTPDDLSLDERRNQIVQKYTNVGGLNKTFYEFIGQQLGFEIFVNDFTNFKAGFAVAGDPISNFFNEIFVAGSTAGTFLTNVGWRFYFNVDMPITAAEVFEAGDVAGSPLRLFSNPLIECTMLKLKPAHSAIFFTFRV